MERRKTVRSYITIPVRYSEQASAKTEGSTLCKDIGSDGLAIILSESVPKGTLVDLEISLPDTKENAAAKGKVIWQHELQNSGGTGNSRFATGLQFTEITQDARAQLEGTVANSLKLRSEDVNTTLKSLIEAKFNPTHRQFAFHKRVVLKDTNVEGNVYFARFFEWQGESREEFFRQNVPDHAQLLQSGTRLITVNAWIAFQRSAYLFDELLIDVKTAQLKNLSLELIFTFIHKATGEILAYGGQKLAFSDPKETIIPVPPSIRENARYFLVDSVSVSSETYEKMQHSKIASTQ